MCLLFTFLAPQMSISITVQFLNNEPVYIALGRPLALEARFQLQSGERIMLYTWERKNSYGEVRVAEGNQVTIIGASVEKNGALLKLAGVTEKDYGNYKITVTDASGNQVYAQRDVLKMSK